MADTNNGNADDTEQGADTSELDDFTDDEAEQLLADAVAADNQESGTDSKDWQAEVEKWRAMSRKNEKSYKDAAAKLKQYEDANKSEAERLQESLNEHQTRAKQAETALKRREIAEERAPEHASMAQIKAVAKRLSGESDEDMTSDADELFELIAPVPTAPKTPTRPKERLKGGSEPDEDPEPSDPKKLAALIPRRR